MNVCSIGFLIALLCVTAIIFHLPAERPRQILLALCNVAFLASWVPNFASWVALLTFVLSGYLVAIMAGGTSSGSARRPILAGYIALLVVTFVALKHYSFVDLLFPNGAILRGVMIVGLSYILFRQIHFVVDTAEGQIQSASLWDYLNYQLGFATLLVGPIQRFPQFKERWDALEPILTDQHDLLKAYARMLFGMLKIAVIGAFCLKISDKMTAVQLHYYSPKDWIRFAVLFYAFPAYVYFNFSGSCDVVIAAGMFVGLRLPENFNHPFLARNVIDFSARWHMTLTHWIRDYLFTPVYKNLAERWPDHAMAATYFSYFTALFVAGIWHGSSWNFVVFGLLHGMGVSAAKIWEDFILRRRKRAGLREYLKSPGIRAVAIAVTLNFVCFTFLFFRPGLRSRVNFLHRFLSESPAETRLVELRSA